MITAAEASHCRGSAVREALLFISRVWVPHSVATVSAGASSFGIPIGVDIGSNVIREFWPDLKHYFRKG